MARLPPRASGLVPTMSICTSARIVSEAAKGFAIDTETKGQLQPEIVQLMQDKKLPQMLKRKSVVRVHGDFNIFDISNFRILEFYNFYRI